MVTQRFWKIALTVFCSLAFCTTLFADEEDIKAQINRIKSDEAYLGAECTHEDWGAAYLHSIDELQYYLNLMRVERGMDTLSVRQVSSGVHSLKHNRGSRVRVFAYVKLEDMLKDVPDPDTTPTDFSPLPDSPPVEEKDSVATNTEVIVAVPVKEEASEAAEPEKPEVPVVRQTVSSSGLIEVVMLLRQVQMIGEAVLDLEQYKRDGKVQDYASVKGLSDIQDNMFLIMFDKQSKKIKALLEVQQGQYRNIKTNQKEGLDAYRGCAAYWFK